MSSPLVVEIGIAVGVLLYGGVGLTGMFLHCVVQELAVLDVQGHIIDGFYAAKEFKYMVEFKLKAHLRFSLSTTNNNRACNDTTVNAGTG